MSSIQPPPGADSFIQQFAQQFTSTATFLLTTVDAAVTDISRVAYVTILMVGALLYFTHASIRLGKDLMKGGILLAIVVEFVFPWLVRL
jgi:glycerol uptake facilitator-like aquaporin